MTHVDVERPLLFSSKGRVGWDPLYVDVNEQMKRGFGDVSPGDEPSSSSAGVAAALDRATSMGSFVFNGNMPWELTPALRFVFSDESEIGPALPSIPRNLPPVPALKSELEISVEHKKASIQRRCYSVAENLSDEDRANVLLRWVDLILMCPTGTRVGRQILEDFDRCQGSDKSDEASKSFQIVADSLRAKSTSTLKLRANSFVLYVKWYRDTHGDEPFLPLVEGRVYDCVCFLRSKACSASRASTFVSTLNFVEAVLGVEGVTECVNSSRIKGAALEMFLSKRTMKQAPPLTPEMIATIEVACFCEPDTFLRALAGFCLCCIFGRLRVSDLARLVNLSSNGEYAEGSLMRTKTARSKEKQCTFLPVIFPCVGFIGLNWFQAFCASRRFLELPEFPTLESDASDKSFVVLPSRATCHLELGKKIGSTEVSEGLRRILGKFFSEEMVGMFTSHSMKTTLLTYVNIYGCDYTVAELLGYHVTSHLSALNYQRDALAQPIRILATVLKEIQVGRFDPTASRGQAFPSATYTPPVVEKLQKVLNKTVNEMAEIFMGFDPSSDMDMFGNFEMRSTWELICKEPVIVGTSNEPMLFGAIGTELREVQDSSDEDSDYSDSDSSSAESAMAEASVSMRQGTLVKNMSDRALPHVMIRHARTRRLHLGNKDDELKTACGRGITEAYEKFLGNPDKCWPHCVHCWGNFNP